MPIAKHWLDAKMAMNNAGIDLSVFDSNLETVLGVFDEAYERYLFANAQRSRIQTQLLAEKIQAGGAVETIAIHYGEIVKRLYDSTTDSKSRIALLIASSHIMNIVSEVNLTNM